MSWFVEAWKIFKKIAFRIYILLWILLLPVRKILKFKFAKNYLKCRIQPPPHSASPTFPSSVPDTSEKSKLIKCFLGWNQMIDPRRNQSRRQQWKKRQNTLSGRDVDMSREERTGSDVCCRGCCMRRSGGNRALSYPHASLPSVALSLAEQGLQACYTLLAQFSSASTLRAETYGGEWSAFSRSRWYLFFIRTCSRFGCHIQIFPFALMVTILSWPKTGRPFFTSSPRVMCASASVPSNTLASF